MAFRSQLDEKSETNNKYYKYLYLQTNKANGHSKGFRSKLEQITLIINVCARLVQLLRSLTANQKVPGSIPGLVEG